MQDVKGSKGFSIIGLLLTLVIFIAIFFWIFDVKGWGNGESIVETGREHINEAEEIRDKVEDRYK